jgi:hypothetical protein
MTYKTNTPNYITKKVSNFSDFIDNIESEKKELKSIKRSINHNHNDTQKYPKNSKFKFNKITRKMDDLTLSEIEDKIEESSKITDLKIYQSELNMLNKIKSTGDKNVKRKKFLEKEIDKLKSELGVKESLSNTINSMSRFIEDYAANHSAFEKRGMDEGVEILRKSKDLEEAIEKINRKIEDWELKEKADLMPQDQREDIIKGLRDLLTNLEAKMLKESHIDNDVFMKISKLESYNKLRNDFKSLVDDFTSSLENEDWIDLGDSDHVMSINSVIQEALNESMF